MSLTVGTSYSITLKKKKKKKGGGGGGGGKGKKISLSFDSGECRDVGKLYLRITELATVPATRQSRPGKCRALSVSSSSQSFLPLNSLPGRNPFWTPSNPTSRH